MHQNIHKSSRLKRDLTLSTDVVVIGSGPGGALVASRFAAAGAKVIVLEEGTHVAPAELVMHEEDAYPRLYQDGGSRATEDLSIMILQGRTVGGGSIVNWMTSLRTPDRTLRVWKEKHAVEAITPAVLDPHFASVERRLHIHPAEDADVNANNRVLLDGARALGYTTTHLPRNSVACENLGLCSLGCPVDAKQTAANIHVSEALGAGAKLYCEARAIRLERSGTRVTHVVADAVDPLTRKRLGPQLRIAAGRVIVAGGAINSPALLLRSGFDNASIGRRTWLHPVVATVAEFDRDISPWYGSPQSIACQTFADRGSAIGYFIETPPVLPMLGSLALPVFGARHRTDMQRLRQSNALIALTIDGFHDSEAGGTVRVKRDGRIVFDYALGPRNFESFRESMKTMARIQFAAGAKRVITLHTDPVEMRSPDDLPAIDAARFEPNTLSIFSAHQMGGCAMGEDPARSVVDSRGKMHGIDNVSVCDGSVFPTALGVNPMLSIYAVASHFAEQMERAG